MKSILVLVLVALTGAYFYAYSGFRTSLFDSLTNKAEVMDAGHFPSKDLHGNPLYEGKIRHIFFHSLVVYPKLAFIGDKRSSLYEKYMITRDEFVRILPELYRNNFMLIDINSLYKIKNDGTLVKKPLYLPKGKKPLIISLDDLNYYHTMAGRGFADKLVLDKEGNVATEIVTPEGKKEVTRDGDVVPILDDFIALHPDFSFGGAKGVIAVTGFQGILGYRTDSAEVPNYSSDVEDVKKVISKLKETGWSFANHSYSHDKAFVPKTISENSFKKDLALWDKEVRPLVGETHIFIGPFGQIFSPQDPRREYLISHGFKVICGVGMDAYFHYFPDSLVMDRADIDGYRLLSSPNRLSPYFDAKSVIDPLR